MAYISIIAVVAKSGAIGRNNNLLCHLPGDLKYFKELTLGHTIVMGKNTFLSLPKGALPGRRNIILTHGDAKYENTVAYHSLDDVLVNEAGSGELFIIGGEQIYSQFIGIADRLYITEIDHEFEEADRFFPDIDKTVWQESFREYHAAYEKNPYPYSFVVYNRKSLL